MSFKAHIPAPRRDVFFLTLESFYLFFSFSLSFSYIQRGVRHSPKFLPLISCAAFSYPENTCMPRTPARQLNNLWITRKHAGLGQKTVARLLGHRSTSVISEYETGRLLPSLPTALRLAVVYNRPITELYPDLFRKIREEVQEIRSKRRITINQAPESAPEL